MYDFCRAAARENLSSVIPTRSDTNKVVQPHKISRGLKFWSLEEEGLLYLRSENKGTDQLPSYCAADLCLHFL